MTTTEIRFYGASDDLVILEGIYHDREMKDEEFYPGADDTWAATIQDIDGNTAQLYASFCKENPDGWHVAVTDEFGECPWPMTKTTVPGRPEDEPDPMIVLTVPAGVVVQEDE